MLITVLFLMLSKNERGGHQFEVDAKQIFIKRVMEDVAGGLVTGQPGGRQRPPQLQPGPQCRGGRAAAWLPSAPFPPPRN